MANELKIMLALALIGLGAIPAQAATPPTVTAYVAEQPAINQTRFILMFDAPIENLEKDDFEVTAGCSIGYLEIQGATAQVELVECPTGLVTLTLKSNSMGLGTLGPIRDLKFELEIDATEPTATFSDIQIEGSGPFTYTTLLRFSEVVEFDADKLRFSANASCNTSIVEISEGLRLRASCSYADLSWTLPARSLKDNAGHLGPSRDVRISVANPAPPPVAPPVSVPVLPPAPIPVLPPAPALPPVMVPPPPPIESTAPTESATVSESVQQVTESATLPMEPPIFVSIAPALTPVSLPANAAQLNLLEIIQEEQPQQGKEEAQVAAEAATSSSTPKATLETLPVAGGKYIVEPQDNSFGVWLIGLGSLMLICFGLFRRFNGR
jgi:hypothetical protein